VVGRQVAFDAQIPRLPGLKAREEFAFWGWLGRAAWARSARRRAARALGVDPGAARGWQ